MVKYDTYAKLHALRLEYRRMPFLTLKTLAYLIAAFLVIGIALACFKKHYHTIGLEPVWPKMMKISSQASQFSCFMAGSLILFTFCLGCYGAISSDGDEGPTEITRIDYAGIVTRDRETVVPKQKRQLGRLNKELKQIPAKTMYRTRLSDRISSLKSSLVQEKQFDTKYRYIKGIHKPTAAYYWWKAGEENMSCTKKHINGSHKFGAPYKNRMGFHIDHGKP